MLEQYYSIKRNYKDHILLFRMGDFYEMFGEDAKIGSKELDIVLTSRAKHPLAGIPYHAVEQYVGRLIKKGYKVAICEQVEDASSAKGLVKREVVRIITPGTVLESTMLEDKSNNYIACLTFNNGIYGISHADVSTGEFLTAEITGDDSINKLISELSRIKPSELLIPKSFSEDAKFLENLKNTSGAHITFISDDDFKLERTRSILLSYFNVTTLEPFGCEDKIEGTKAAGTLLGYIRENGKASSFLILGLRTYNTTEFMLLDSATQRNLELVKNIRDGSTSGTLLELLDHTSTSMGGRLLKRWILEPLLDIKKIEKRLNAVEFLVSNSLFRGDVCESLKGLHDLERLMTRIAYGTANARDLIALKSALATAEKIKNLLSEHKESAEEFKEIYEKLDPCTDIISLIEKAILENPPVSVREGGMIKEGFSSELDTLKASIKEAKDWITTLETRERERTGIKSLKVGFNKVFGYYIEVTN
ncbi:MAG: DNA mismatch repair protein MutS, partial [Thermoplasmata archaeon]